MLNNAHPNSYNLMPRPYFHCEEGGIQDGISSGLLNHTVVTV